jgi:hypothetical protein
MEQEGAGEPLQLDGADLHEGYGCRVCDIYDLPADHDLAGSRVLAIRDATFTFRPK